MASQALEQILKHAPIREQAYQTIDLYAAGTTALYTPPIKPLEIKPIIKENKQNNNIFKPILPNPFSEKYQKEKNNFKPIESPGSILRRQYDLEQGFKLQERFDFSHGEPHINYEIISPYQKKPLKSIL